MLGLFGASRSHLAPPGVIRRPGNCAPVVPHRYTPNTAALFRNLATQDTCELFLDRRLLPRTERIYDN